MSLPGRGIKQGGTGPSALETHYEPSSTAAAVVLHLPTCVPFTRVTKFPGARGSGRAVGCEDSTGSVCLPAMQLSRAEETPAHPATGPTQSLEIKTPLTSAAMVPLPVVEAEAQ